MLHTDPDPPLEILYRDQWLIAINKPAGMLVHPGHEIEPSQRIAMKALRDQIGRRVWPVHRLDRPTSGALLFALSDQLAPFLRQLFDQQAITKKYLAIALGKTPSAWSANSPLQKDPESQLVAAETRFKRIDSRQIGEHPLSMTKALPQTGRFHQIRKHLAADGHPILGDYRYGTESEMNQLEKITKTKGLMLHAAQLSFTHPVNSEEVSIHAPRPQRMTRLLDGQQD